MIRARLEAAYIEGHAEAFRNYYAPRHSRDIEFDLIVEQQLKMKINVEDGILATTEKYGWLAVDGQTIWVDASIVGGDEYVPLILHEVGHAQLHRDLLPTVPLRSAKEFARFHDGVSDAMWEDLEWEARRWAAAVMMPRQELAIAFRDQLSQPRLRTSTQPEHLKSSVEQVLAFSFDVSLMRMRARLNELDLWSGSRRSAPVSPIGWPAVSGGAA